VLGCCEETIALNYERSVTKPKRRDDQNLSLYQQASNHPDQAITSLCD